VNHPARRLIRLLLGSAIVLFLAERPLPDRREAVGPWLLPAAGEGDDFQRWWWAFEQRAYPLGDIPEEALPRAMEEMRRADARALSAPVRLSAGGRWASIGPAPMTGGQIGTGGVGRPMSGRVNVVAADPSDANHWLIGADTGGIWETRDAGGTWAARTEAQASLAMGAIAFAPSDPRTVYAVTGAQLFSGFAYAGGGLLKSTDGGTDWQLLATSALGNLTCGSVKVDPANSNIVLAATSYGTAGRGSEFPSFPPRGILKSTDGGVTWSSRLTGEATSLQVDPTNFNNQYAGLGNVFGAAANGVYRSANAGTTWTKIDGPWSAATGGIGRVSIAIAPSNPNVLYVGIQDAIDNRGVDGGLLGLWQTSSAWSATPAWSGIPVGATDDGSGTHGFCGWDPAYRLAVRTCSSTDVLSVDPANPAVLYAGGVALWKFDGASWTEVSKTASDPANGIHVDQRGLGWAGGRLLVGNDGGVWSTTDGGNTWSDHNTNLSTHEIYGGSLHPSNPDLALIGSQDNGTSRWNGSTWTWFFGGDGSDSAISSAKPDSDWALTAQNLEISRTKDGGSTRSAADAGIDKTAAPFIARLAKCPSSDAAVIAGTDNLWKSTNFFGAGTPGWSSNGPEMGSGITALAFAPSDPACGTYAFGTANGQLRLTNDGGATWKDSDAAGQVPNRYVTGLAFSPADPNTLYATLSGFDEGTPGKPGHVFRTGNALSASPSWSNVSPPVNIPHNAIAIDPTSSAKVYVGTDVGLWTSVNGGASWTHAGPDDGMPNVPVFDLKVDSTGRAVAFTYGRGAFALTTAAGPCSSDATTFCAGSGSRFKVQVTWNTPDGKSGPGQAVALTGDTGYFWFFSSNNVEMVIKVVDGRALNGKFWVFAAGLTNVGVAITVVDTSTGAVRTYTNAQGVAFLPIQDTSAFATAPVEEVRAPADGAAAEGPVLSRGLLRRLELPDSTPPRRGDGISGTRAASCTPDPTTLCLNNGRFQVKTRWTTPQGQTGSGQAVTLTGDTGYFWFFSSNNVEMVTKVVAGCPLNTRYWVFAGGLTNVDVVMTVTDVQTGAVRTYTNPQGTAFAPIQDTAAFNCP
jgi:hypothetical protein